MTYSTASADFYCKIDKHVAIELALMISKTHARFRNFENGAKMNGKWATNQRARNMVRQC